MTDRKPPGDRPARPPRPCPACRERLAHQDFYPFCSHRCKMVDLAKWFGEEFRVGGSDDDAADFDEEGEDSRAS